MPERGHHQAATAELKPNQTDQDTLPPTKVLDGILECLVEREMTVDEIWPKAMKRPRCRFGGCWTWRNTNVGRRAAEVNSIPPCLRPGSSAIPNTNGFKAQS